MAVLEVTAADISCDHCKRNIEGDIGREPGVRSVEVEVATKAVRIDYDESVTKDAVIRDKMADIGYPAS